MDHKRPVWPMSQRLTPNYTLKVLLYQICCVAWIFHSGSEQHCNDIFSICMQARTLSHVNTGALSLFCRSLGPSHTVKTINNWHTVPTNTRVSERTLPIGEVERVRARSCTAERADSVLTEWQVHLEAVINTAHKQTRKNTQARAHAHTQSRNHR